MNLTRITEKLGAIACAIVLSAGAASAAMCTTPEGTNLSVSPTFLTGSNSTGAECYSGNDAQNIGGVRQINVHMAFGFDDWTLAFKNDDGNGDGSLTFGTGPINGGNAGTWQVLNPLGFNLANVLVVLKSGSGYGAFDISALSGDWSSNQQALSHASIWYRDAAPIPVPAAGFLLIGGLGGLVALRRRRKSA